jgi:hypothetical protein
LISAGKQICDEAGAELVLMGVPDASQLIPDGRRRLKDLSGDLPSFDADRPDKELARICESRGLRFRAGKMFLDARCYKTNDCHWNEKGHRKVHEALQRLADEPRGQRIEAMTSAFAEA